MGLGALYWPGFEPWFKLWKLRSHIKPQHTIAKKKKKNPIQPTNQQKTKTNPTNYSKFPKGLWKNSFYAGSIDLF